MVIERWSPFRDLLSWERAMRRPFTMPYRAASVAHGGEWSIPLDIERDGDDYVVKGSLPGAPPEDIEITIEDGVLTLAAQTASESEREEEGHLLRERRLGAFRRAVRLPKSIDPEKATCTYEHGVVTVRLPLAEERKAKRLTLSISGAGSSAAVEGPKT